MQHFHDLSHGKNIQNTRSSIVYAHLPPGTLLRIRSLNVGYDPLAVHGLHTVHATPVHCCCRVLRTCQVLQLSGSLCVLDTSLHAIVAHTTQDDAVAQRLCRGLIHQGFNAITKTVAHPDWLAECTNKTVVLPVLSAEFLQSINMAEIVEAFESLAAGFLPVLHDMAGWEDEQTILQCNTAAYACSIINRANRVPACSNFTKNWNGNLTTLCNSLRQVTIVALAVALAL